MEAPAYYQTVHVSLDERRDGRVCSFCGRDCPISAHLLRLGPKQTRKDMKLDGWLVFRRAHDWTDPHSGKKYEKGIVQLACPGCWVGSGAVQLQKAAERTRELWKRRAPL